MAIKYTFETAIASGEVGLEFGKTRVDAVERLVGQRYLAAPSAGAD